ncbi:uncharacterized protein LOC110225883 [Arabidopsis lyrata subsp. lyrata]|uniref:uncharacterized protein LOC110225883 n=1 Tax=Arabidopsis lyrata subsp. lyrata TaxID=81972 RepID=UPI000A29E83A|nr:uncharacterized protein LOC110225883 [Arabidopsis lyrata subsp. lyrata]|eukprot:XP_020871812.1 uncharacterized protein LOC110225883 [Arabidopsis lyrata subsp. lyrata]
MEISQDPIKGVYQSSDRLWSRVLEAYEKEKNPTWSERSTKSIQCRIQTIEKVTRKLHACIKQCENRRPSGASSDDIFNQAKVMLMEDQRYKGGWKFDHVWNIIKNFEKFKDGDTSSRKISNPLNFGYISSESENPTPDSATQASPGLSSFSLNLDGDDDNIGGSPSQHPMGVKKSKLKRKIDDQTSIIINTLEEGNKQLLEQLKKTSAQRQQHLEIQSKNYALKELKADNKMLLQDLNSIEDPEIRAYVQAEKARILQKRNEEKQNQQAPSGSTSFGQYFNYLSGSGNELPDY